MNVLTSILRNKVVAIIRGANPKDMMKIADALYAGGVRVVEITLNSPGALKVIEELTDQLGEKMLVGAGSVLDAESARAAISAGAKFILSPTVNMNTINMTKRYGAVSIPGAFTPTEILAAYENGGDIIKVFPASFGPSYIKNIRGPLPQIPLLPTGGVDLNNIREFMAAGAVGCGIGSALVNTKVEVTDHSLAQLTERARHFVLAVGLDPHLAKV
jgi:2-dehydro-3-deoxyphosphogluconate aldolase / (4S)-4-hydroxy-2-oxoglutarate aldolase